MSGQPAASAEARDTALAFAHRMVARIRAHWVARHGQKGPEPRRTDRRLGALEGISDQSAVLSLRSATLAANPRRDHEAQRKQGTLAASAKPCRRNGPTEESLEMPPAFSPLMAARLAAIHRKNESLARADEWDFRASTGWCLVLVSLWVLIAGWMAGLPDQAEGMQHTSAPKSRYFCIDLRAANNAAMPTACAPPARSDGSARTAAR